MTKIVTVQDLINELSQLPDKNKPIIIDNIYDEENSIYSINEIENFTDAVYIWLNIEKYNENEKQ